MYQPGQPQGYAPPPYPPPYNEAYGQAGGAQPYPGGAMGQPMYPQAGPVMSQPYGAVGGGGYYPAQQHPGYAQPQPQTVFVPTAAPASRGTDRGCLEACIACICCFEVMRCLCCCLDCD